MIKPVRAIATPRLILRGFRPSDAADLRRIILQYNATPMHYYDRPWPTSEREIRAITDWFTTNNGFWAVCLKDTGQLIGLISLNRSDDAEWAEYELGYLFDADFHGKGYATESCQTLIRQAFTAWQAERLIAGTAAVNEPSRRLLERLGFHKLRETRECFQSAPDGTPIEFPGIYYGLTREDWERSQKG